jgi:hypothetical protein
MENKKKPGAGEYLLSLGIMAAFGSLIFLDFGLLRAIIAVTGFAMILLGVILLKLELPEEPKETAKMKTFEEAWRKKKRE